MTVAVIDSGGANIASVMHALSRLNVDATFTADPDVIRSADRVILPGVGAARAAMQRLTELNLVEVIPTLKQPVLGICLGMQLLFEKSEEGNVDCLGLIPGTVAKMKPQPGLRIPHTGWNQIDLVGKDPLLAGLQDSPWFYFVHGYSAPITSNTLATSCHGKEFAAVVRKDNFYGAQFHPERSSVDGSTLLANFLELS